MIKRTCKQCGKKFYIYPYKLRVSRGKFCSHLCYSKWRKGKFVSEDNPSWKGGKIRRICQYCGKQFKASPFSVKKGASKFCSRKCYAKWRSENLKGGNSHNWRGGGIKRVCGVCGKEFYIRKARETKSGGRFCSSLCYGKWLKIHNRGRNNPCWKPKVKKTCELCGKQFEVKPARGNTAKFCSMRCAGLSKYLKIIQSPNYRQPLLETLIENELLRLDISYQKQVLLCAIAVVDFYLPDDKTIIQCDDRFHLKPDAIERDDNQDTILTSQGYRVFRLEEKEINKSPFYSLRKVLLRMRA